MGDRNKSGSPRSLASLVTTNVRPSPSLLKSKVPPGREASSSSPSSPHATPPMPSMVPRPPSREEAPVAPKPKPPVPKRGVSTQSGLVASPPSPSTNSFPHPSHASAPSSLGSPAPVPLKAMAGGAHSTSSPNITRNTVLPSSPSPLSPSPRGEIPSSPTSSSSSSSSTSPSPRAIGMQPVQKSKSSDPVCFSQLQQQQSSYQPPNLSGSLPSKPMPPGTMKKSVVNPKNATMQPQRPQAPTPPARNVGQTFYSPPSTSPLSSSPSSPSPVNNYSPSTNNYPNNNNNNSYSSSNQNSYSSNKSANTNSSNNNNFSSGSERKKRPPSIAEANLMFADMTKATSLEKMKCNLVEYESRSSLYLQMKWLTIPQAQTYAPKRLNAYTFVTSVDEATDTYPAEVYNQPLKKIIAETSNLTLRKSLEYQLLVLPRRRAMTAKSSFGSTTPKLAPSSSVVMGLRSGNRSSLDTEQIEESSLDGAIELEEENSPDLVQIKNEDGTITVKGGTVRKLIEKLTSAGAIDPDYLTAFLLTYRSFTTPNVLLDELIERYNIKPPSDCTGAHLEQWRQKKQKPIRLRVCNALKHWIERHFSDFIMEDELLRKLTEFTDETISNTPGLQVVGTRLHKLIEKKLSTSSLEGNASALFPEPTNSRLSLQGLGARSKRSLLDYDPGDIAKQLTLLEFSNYKVIQPRECLNQAWNKSDKEINAPNIVNMIKRTNAVPLWVATEIVFCDKPKQRSNLVKLFISIAEKCRSLNNFNAVMEISSGLQLSAIYRLKRTWEGVPQKSMAAFEEMKELMKVSSNWKAYREALKKCNPPCVPYLGVYLTDLTFTEDGNPDRLEGGELINFIKRKKLSVVIQEIQQYQNMPYSIEVNQPIRDYLNDMQWVNENELWNMSLICEPREATPTSD
eukprot:TRINITY_DN1744_c0_g3_i1.p1 TRINITY_DN1744_c0_g3~~TRINITY_DN1744_c0_g3_i1.p1  ORF type:complete len:906 (-),score=236.37 TRINITY_DN1744_c0_g3_i1:10-2727(-)